MTIRALYPDRPDLGALRKSVYELADEIRRLDEILDRQARRIRALERAQTRAAFVKPRTPNGILGRLWDWALTHDGLIDLPAVCAALDLRPASVRRTLHEAGAVHIGGWRSGLYRWPVEEA